MGRREGYITFELGTKLGTELGTELGVGIELGILIELGIGLGTGLGIESGGFYVFNHEFYCVCKSTRRV